MNKRILSFFMAFVMLLGLLPASVSAASTLEEAMADVSVYAKDKELNYLTMNGSVKEQHYTYYNYKSEQTGETKEIPAYCVDPRLYGVPAKVPEGTPIHYSAESTITDPKLCGIITNGYPHMTLNDLGLQSVDEAYYATKTAVWIYLLGNWTISGLGINPNLTGADKEAAQRVLQATKLIYQRGMYWNEMYSPKLAATPDRSTAYAATINGEECYQQIFVIDSDTWALTPVMLSLEEGAPAGTKIMSMDNSEISQIILSTERTSGAGYQGQVKVVYPKSAVEGQTGTCQLVLNASVVEYKLFYAHTLEADKYGNLQNYILDTDPNTPVTATAISSYSSEPDTPDDPEDPGDPTPEESTLKIVKLEAGTEKPLAGAEFRVLYPNGNVYGVYHTDSSGMITLPINVFGNYTVTETVPPKYHLLPEHTTQNVIVTALQGGVLTFYNEPFGNLRVHKVSDTGDNLNGVTVQIKNLETGETQSGQTASGGVIEFTNLKPGGYEIRELAGIEGYVADVEATKTATVVTGQTSEVTFVNEEKPGLKIVKYDRATLRTMADVSFRVWKDGTLLGDYSTDAMGEILLPNLEPGTYVVQEIADPNSHIVDPTPQQIELKAGDGVKQLLFYNDQKPGIHLVKVDSENLSKVIPNVKFRIASVDGTWGPKEYTTDVHGEIDLSELPTGAYTVTELECPGYVIDKASRIIELTANSTAEFVFTNTKKPVIEVVKFDPNTGRYLAGATFRIAKIEDASHYLDRVTDTNGRIRIEDLEPGIYSVQEIAAPSGYVLNDTEYHVELFPGRTSELVVNNEKKPDLKIIKTDANTGAPVAGATFTIRKIDSSTLLTETTDRNGEIFLSELDPGVYEITEQSVPDGYLLDPIPQKITLFPDKLGVVQFQDFPKPSLLIKKINSVTGKVLEGARFHVIYGSNHTFTGEINDIGEYYTDENGEILLEKLKDGWYKVQEMEAPAGYRIKDDGIQECYVAAGHSKVLTFENVPLSTILIQKMDEETGKPLPGATFRVKYLNSMTSIDGTTLGEYITDESGSIELTGLDEGTYVVDELSAPAGYVLNAANTRTVYLSGENQDFISLIYGNQKMGSLLIVKKDALTGEPLSGVEFFVTDSDGAVVGNGNGKFTTDYAGSILIPNLEPGKTIVAKETRTVSGYILDDTPQTVKIKANETVTLEFRDQPKGTLIVQKVDEATGEPLTGAEFRITMSNGELIADNEGLTSSNGLYTVDRNGQVVLEKLNPGTYIITETKAPDGYILSAEPVTVAVGPADTQTILIGNPKKGGLVIHKLDSLTHDPLSGVEFSVKYADGTLVDNGQLSSSGRYVTDRNGQIILSDITGTLIVTEEKTVAGYVIDQATRTQTVVVNTNDTQDLYFYNTPRGALMIRKVDSATGEPLEGAEFTVVPANSEQADTGLTGTTFTTDRSGQIVLEQLLPVSYVITETKAPENYVLDAQPQVTTVKAGDTSIVTFADSHKGSLTIHKLDALTHEPLEGVQFKLAYADGTVVDDGNLSGNGTYVTDRNGQIVVANITGTVVATEVATISGYVIDPESRSQTVEVRPNDAQHLTFYNAPKGSLVIQKYDKVTNQPLADAVFSITTANGEPVAANEGLTSTNGLYRTDENGMIILTKLTPQTYIVTETEAPKGYALDAQTQTVVVSSSDTQYLRFYDEPLAVLTLLKRDAVSKLPLANAEFTVKTADGTAIGTDNGRYITDETGTATITGIEPDTAVVVSEDSAPAGYVANATPKTIMVRSGIVNSLTFDDEPTTTLIIKKYIEGTNNEPLAGVGFRVTDSNGAAVGPSNGTFYTDRAGEIMITGLAPGITVTASEFKTVDGFILDGTPQNIKIENYQRMELVFWNARKGSLTVRKLDSVTREPLAGVEFKINYADGTPVDDNNGSTSTNGRYFTDRNGEITINGVHGTVVVYEVATIPGYTIDPDGRSQTVVVNADDHQTLTFTNTPKQALTIQKLERGTNNPIEGVKFLVTDSSGAVLGTENGEFVTDRNGRIVLENLTPGTTITAKEVQTVSGYVLDPTLQSILIRSGEAQTMSFFNAKKGSLTIEKRDSITNELLPGAVFKVTTLDGEPVNDDEGRNVTRGIYSTDRSGQIILTKLQPDTYVVQEIEAPEGYSLNGEKQTVKVNAEEAQTLTFTNVPLQTVIIQKYVEGTTDPLAGVRFLVTDTAGNPVGGENGEYVTDQNGRILISGVEAGTSLVAREVKTVKGFQLNSMPQTIQVSALSSTAPVTSGTASGSTASSSNTLTFFDDPLSTLVVKKYVKGTNREPLAGVAFKITDGSGAAVGNTDGVHYTNASGEIIIENLAKGTVLTVREVATVDGFVLDGTPKQIEIQNSDVHELVFWNERQGSLTIRKLDSATQKPLEGVTFKITTAEGEFAPDQNGHVSSNGLYKTDAAGEIILTGVTGTLVVTETETIPGYTIREATRSQTVVVKPDDHQQLTFYNDPMQSLTIKKYVSGTTDPIKGVRFRVVASDGKVVGSSNGEFLTNESGEIVLPNLVPGTTITAQELETVSGFVLDTTPKSIRIESGEAQTLVFYNQRKGGIIIEKRDAQTDALLAGAEFRVTTSGGMPVDADEGRTSTDGIYVTDEHGQIVLQNLNPDTYIVTETKAPEGYVLTGEKQTVKVNANDTQTVKFFNTALQSVTIRKLVEGTDKPLAGVTFLVTDANNTPIGNGTYVTDENGEITLTGLTPGMTLIVRETRTVKGYQLNSTPRTIVVGGGSMAARSMANSILLSAGGTTQTGTNSITVYDEPLSTLVVKKYIKGTDRQPLEGVAFKITDGNGGNVGPNDGVWYTNNAGEITVPDLESGTVLTVREIATVDGYILDGNPKQVQIKSSDVHELVFWNAKQGALVIRTLDSATQHPLEGVTVKVTTATGEFVPDKSGKISSNGLYKSDAAGEIILTGVTGTLVVSEVETIDGYTIHEASRSQTIVVEPDDTQQLTVYSDPTQILTVNLYEAGTTNPIPGATFKLTGSDGKVIGSSNGIFTTDASGKIVVSGLVPGTTITAQQLTTIGGYVLDSSPQSIEIKSGSAMNLTFFNEKKGALIIEKRDAQTGALLAGAEFKVTTIDGAPVDDNEGRTSTQGLYVTDENGQITLLNLEPNTYVIAETKAPSGYIPDSAEKSVKVNENDTQTVKFTNTALQSVTIQKFVEGTNTPLAGVTFLVTDANGSPIGGGNGEFQTDSNGRIVLTGLVPGTTLIVREVKTVKGFVLNGEPKTIVVGTGAAASSGGSAFTSSGAATGAPAGNTLSFFDEPLSTLIVTKLAAESNTPLKGARFLITDSTGKAIGNSMGEFTTDENGRIVLKDLQPGITVTAKEIEAPKGYVLDSTPKSIEIQSGDVQELTFLNTSKQTLTINKFVTGTTDPLQGAAFLITDQTGAAVGSGSGEFLTDENGRIELNDLTPGSVITAKEIRAAEGFVLDSTPKSITIQSGEAQHLDFYNSTTGTLTIIKRDRATNKTLKGAIFQLTYSNGEFVANNGGALGSNGTFTTDSKGQIIIKGLNPSTIIIREIKAPDGYLLDETPVTVEIGADGSQTVDIFNDSTQTLTIQKFVADTTNPIQGVTFLITDSTGATLGPDNGEFVTDRNGHIVLTGLEPGTTITAKEVKTAKGFVLDTTPQSIQIKQGEAQRLTFYNSPEGGLELIKVNASDKAKRIENVTFEIRRMDGGLVETVTTGKNGRVYVNLDAGNYYAVEIEAAKGFKLDNTPQYFEIVDGKTTTLTVANTPFSGIEIHKIDSTTGEGIYGAKFLLYDAEKHPVGEYESDQNGYVYIDDLTRDGKYFIRELECEGYNVDTQMKTINLKAGEIIQIEWKNDPVTGQIQIYKYAAEYNAVTGTAAGATLQGAVFEIVEVRSGKVVDYITTDARGVAASKPLPLKKYQVKEVTAPAYWQVDGTVHDVTLEYPGQIIKLSAYDKPAELGVSITKRGNASVMAGQQMMYTITVANTSNVALDNFYWHDRIPTDIAVGTVLTTGTYSARLNYRVLYKTNYSGDYQVLASNLLTTSNYSFALNAIPTQAGEVVTEVLFEFGKVPVGFQSVTAPTLSVCVNGDAANGYTMVNRADVGGQYGGTWETGNASWATTIIQLTRPGKLPKTGY